MHRGGAATFAGGVLTSAGATAVSVVPLAERSLSAALGVAVMCASAPLASGAFNADAVRQQAAARLPPYMVPSHYLFRDKFQLTANHKV